MAGSPTADAPHRLEASIASGDALDIRHFQVAERLNELFEVTIDALCENPDINLEAVIGQPMSFTARKGAEGLEVHTWKGICRHIEQSGAEERGLSTYRLVLVPVLWLLTQRRNHRMFQHVSELEIARKLLGEWGVSTRESLSGAYKKRKYRVQYGESDFTFLCRMLEDAGISFYFQTDDGDTRLVLHDAPQSSARRSPPIAFRDHPTETNREHVTAVHVGRSVRPGKYTVRDHDYRRSPAYDLRSSAQAEGGVEEALEQFEYTPGAFLYESDGGAASPVADDKGSYRTDEKEAKALSLRRLEAERAPARSFTFETNTLDLGPGATVSFLDHPKSELAPGKALLVTGVSFHGEMNGKWVCRCEAVSAEHPYRPSIVTPKPKTSGVESATVVGSAGEEIHTDEFGRVRVHFHWDRESRMNESSSCWIHASQPWGGTGFGGTSLPRVGQEVIVDFLGGDPDRPIIVGRVYTNLQKTPYKLPDNKTQSGWQSRSSPGGGGDNYNELMFEDKKGQELLRMQAEKDLAKLVKHDEAVKIGHDRDKQVGHDDTLTVGHDRTRQVVHDETVSIGHDETVSIGNDRTRLVGNNESVTVGNSRSKSVAVNEALFVGANQNEQIGANRSVQVGANHSETVGANMSVAVGAALSESVGMMKTETVALASAETVGLAKALTVGGAYAITVGGLMTTNVALMQTQSVGMSQTETIGMTKTVTVGDRLELICGKASIVLEKDGKIAIKGTEITVNGTQIVVTASGQAELHGATVKITGDRIDLN
jgi:type VI secretion system secreted protein VgrG